MISSSKNIFLVIYYDRDAPIIKVMIPFNKGVTKGTTLYASKLNIASSSNRLTNTIIGVNFVGD